MILQGIPFDNFINGEKPVTEKRIFFKGYAFFAYPIYITVQIKPKVLLQNVAPTLN